MLGQLWTRAQAAAWWTIGLALPPRCPGCGAVTIADHSFCVTCWQALDFLGDPCCAQCGAPLAWDLGSDARCGACLADPPAFDRARAAVAYGEVARSLVLKLKHGRRPGLARTIARLLDRIALPDDAILVAVPLHRWRIWWRGFNQSALIARSVARRRGLVDRPGLLVRTRATPMLRGMGPNDRRKAVRGAFAVDPAQRPALKGAAVVLVDDVFTTGATAHACAKALKRAGAREVHLVTWARVVRDGVDK